MMTAMNVAIRSVKITQANARYAEAYGFQTASVHVGNMTQMHGEARVRGERI